MIAEFVVILLLCAGNLSAGSRCGAPPEIPNAVAAVNLTSAPYVSAVYTCKEHHGYAMKGNNTIFCFTVLDYSVWSAINFTCNRVDNPCGAPPLVPNAIATVNASAAPFVTAVYSCNARQGFILRGYDTIACVTVFDYSLWSSANFTCERVQCQGKLKVENTTTETDYHKVVLKSRRCSYYDRSRSRNGCSYYTYTTYDTTYTPKDVYYGGHVNVTCREGYQYADNITETQIDCGVDGQWIYPNETCRPKDCGPIEDYVGVACDDAPTIYPTTVNCRCEEGYERTFLYVDHRIWMHFNLTANVYNISCAPSGTWSHPNDTGTPNCTRIRCDEPPNVLHGSKNITGYYINDTTTYQCDDGYFAYGNSTIDCLNNGEWMPPPECRDITNPCGDPPGVINATVVVNIASPLVTAVYSCDASKGYVLRGNDTITCVMVSDYGVWSSVNVSCERVQCQGHPQVENTTTSTDYRVKTVKSRRCSYYERDYRRNGCSYYTYTVYETVYNTSIVYYGGHVNVTCRDGYQFSDNTTDATIDCDSDGQWIYPNETCQPINCGPIESVKGVGCENKPTVYPTEVKCQCSAGYERNVSSSSRQMNRYGDPMRDHNGQYLYINITDNDYKIKCEASGTWSIPDDSHRRVCERVFCPPPQQVGFSEHNRTLVRGVRYGDTATYLCMHGYSSKTNTTVSCQANKTWTTMPRCEGKDCGDPPALPNGYIKGGYVINTLVGATVSYECELGYRRVGTNLTRCGEQGMWSALPTCHKIRCGTPPVISNARRIVGGHYFSDTTTYQCNTGFQLYGGANSYCQFDGQWTATPECHAISCGAPPTVSHATAIIESSLQFGDKVDYQCFKGYNLSGNSFVTCLPTGHWSTAPTCYPSNGIAPPTTYSPYIGKVSVDAPKSAKIVGSSDNKNHTALMAAMIALAVVVALVLMVVAFRYIVKWRRKRSHMVVSSVHNALYNSDGDRMTLYSFKSSEDNGNQATDTN